MRRRTAAAQVTLVIGACWVQESVPAGAKPESSVGAATRALLRLLAAAESPLKIARSLSPDAGTQENPLRSRGWGNPSCVGTACWAQRCGVGGEVVGAGGSQGPALGRRWGAERALS